MHVSELTRKFQQFVGKTLNLMHDNSMDGQAKNARMGDNQPDASPNEKCPYTRRVMRQMYELGGKFNAEVIINGAAPKTGAKCHVYVDVGDGLYDKNGTSITGIEARVCG
jgi:hypothetical protein